MKFGYTLNLTLVFLVLQVFSINLSVKSTSNEDVYPLIVEYIEKYQIKTNDLKDVINNQFSSITIGQVKTSSA